MTNEEIKILLVDDDVDIAPLVQTKLQKNISRGKCVITTALTGKDALEKMNEQEFDIVLLDIGMPDISGLELLDEIHRISKNIKIIMISADGKIENIRTAMNQDAFDFILKPIDFKDLGNTIEKSISHIEVEQDAQHQIQESYEKLKRTMEQVIVSISSIEEMRDPYTSGHMKRVAQLARSIAIEMGLDQNEVYGIYVTGLLHDIGKIVIPAEILTKPGGLTAKEFGLIKDHAQAGYEIIKKIDFPWPVADMIHQHHEKLDGSGYPQGLKGDEILLGSQIIAIADVLEAVASHRPYRPALGIDKALKVISKEKGIHFSTKIVEVCLKLFLEKDFEFEYEHDDKNPHNYHTYE
jgi:putative nucleotidyltransferase with HDIG domain